MHKEIDIMLDPNNLHNNLVQSYNISNHRCFIGQS